MQNEKFSLFVSKSNSKDFLSSMTTDYYQNETSNLFTFFQNSRYFKLRISNTNEIDWSKSEYVGDTSDEQFNEVCKSSAKSGLI